MIIRKIENALVELATNTGPLLAPIPSGYAVGLSVLHHFGWHWSIAICAALVVEFLGLQAVGVATEFYEYNTNRLKSQPPAPFRLALALVIAYFVVVTALILVLDVWPELSAYAKVIFPLLVLAGFSGRALRFEHQKRLAQNAQEKEERKAERVQKRAQPSPKDAQTQDAQSAQNGPASMHNSPNSAPKGTQTKKERTKSALLDLYKDNPHLGISDAARLVGIHRNSVYNHLSELEAEGRVHRNGGGVVVKD